MGQRKNKDKHLLETVGNRIVQLRKTRLKMNQKEFAKKIGISTAYLRKIEKGEVNSTILQLNKLADILGVSLKELIDIE